MTGSTVDVAVLRDIPARAGDVRARRARARARAAAAPAAGRGRRHQAAPGAAREGRARRRAAPRVSRDDSPRGSGTLLSSCTLHFTPLPTKSFSLRVTPRFLYTSNRKNSE